MNSSTSNSRFIDEATWRHFWHPVCTLQELYSADPTGNGPLQVRLLGNNLVVARLNGVVSAFDDRCVHRSTSLSKGFIDEGRMRCRYHGWAYDDSGQCVDIPACRGMKIPTAAKIGKYDTQVKYDLVWVRLESAAETEIPSCPGFEDGDFKAVMGEPYTWATSAARRLENFVDLAHLPYVHPNTLYDPALTDITPPSIERRNGQLVFHFVPESEDMPIPDVALMGEIHYQMTMPFTVNLEFKLQTRVGRGNRASLWMSASPLDEAHCRSYWFTCRDHGKDEPDYPHVAFQARVLNEDVDVIEAQDPPQIPFDASERSVPTDLVSMQYRRWLREIEAAVQDGSLMRTLNTDKPCSQGPSAASA